MPTHPLLHRRELLQIGGSSLLGIGLPALLAARDASASADERGKGRSAILVLLTGGPSHLDTLDLKPEAPAEIRGEFKPIRTTVPAFRYASTWPGWPPGCGTGRSCGRCRTGRMATCWRPTGC
ncbi:MAG: hypothetical protein U0736_16410 [Gemmataceae bacterium]